MKSVMSHSFGTAPTVSVPRSSFNRSHGSKTTFDAGYLVPVFIDFMYPGDTASLNMAGFSRLSTPINPIMDNMHMETFFFSCSCRVLWDNFKKFQGEQANPGDSIDFTVPIINDFNNAQNESLSDYFALPTNIVANIDINAWFHRLYNKVWNDWFRDENLMDSIPVNTDDGPDSIADYTLKRRCKRHDYFTSCLPNLQKGDSVQLSLGVSAPVGITGTAAGNQLGIKDGNDVYRDMDSSGSVLQSTTGAPGTSDYYLQTDLSAATASTVNELRMAVQVQSLLEKDMRSGTRYVEITKSHFGVTSSDARQQRSEYLGGGSTPVNITPIARTDVSPGTLGAMGVAAFKNHGFTKSFEEHSVVIGLVNVRADINYQEALDRIWTDQTRLDFYLPSLANLGEQAVLNKEIYIDAVTHAAGTCDDVFGYNERWSHLRYKRSNITGKFRSNDSQSLDAWHLAIEFGAQPTLDDTFMEDNPPIDRVIAVPTEPHFIFDSYINYVHTRPLPTYSIPGFVTHF